MKHLRRLLLALFTLLVLVRPGNGCSFSDDDDIPSRADPDSPYSSFLAGKLGIISGDLRIRHLVVAYNLLSGRGLTPPEQKAATDVDRFYRLGDSYTPTTGAVRNIDGQPTLSPGILAWFTPGPDSGNQVERSVPGSDYQTFTNCLDDAFTHATATLADRRSNYTKVAGGGSREPLESDTPEIRDWITAQQAVFSNCNGKGRMPQPEPATAPLWLKQDRAYQMAAASFYATDYDTALAGFRAIAADKASPWSQLSRYVAARVLIRKAVVPFKPDYKTPADGEANLAAVHTGLASARDQLQSILRDPSMAQYHGPAQHLLDYVMIRLDPAAQAEELSHRLIQPPPAKPSADLDRDYRQNVIDLTFIYNSLPLYSSVVWGKGHPPVQPKSPLLRWINDLYGERELDGGLSVNLVFDHDRDHRRDALAAWRSSHEPQWLSVALAVAQPGGDGIPEMSTAARATPPASPAYATVTYHRLRLAAAPASANTTYAELAALMPELERTQPRSTINLFADLQSGIVPSLDIFLRTATRLAPVSIEHEPGEGIPISQPNSVYTPPVVALCGVDVNAPDTPHLDTVTALIFNQRMPLHMLRASSLSPALPGNVRFQVTHMAWTRALLLDDPATASALTPYLAQCQPAIKPWLDQYNAAKTADERHILGLLAMMRFPSTEPTVRVRTERDFAAYDSMRGNWWCNNGGSFDQDPNTPKPAIFFSQNIVPRDSFSNAQPDPPFLTAADRAAADREVAALQKVGTASDYFAQQALDWVKAHPNDPHNADVLGFAMRVVRNACRTDATRELNHQLFDTIHRRYPKSEWALKYTTWE